MSAAGLILALGPGAIAFELFGHPWGFIAYGIAYLVIERCDTT